MPNHVAHRCFVRGDANEIERLRTLVLVEEDGKTTFECDRVIPMPDAVKATMNGPPLGDPAKYEQYCKQQELLRQRCKEATSGDTWRDYLGQEQSGYESWFDWCCNKWGTKWGVYSYEEVDYDGKNWVFTFETAWSPPQPVIEKLFTELFPTITCGLVLFDEMWCYACAAFFENGNGDFMCCDATDEMYEKVYGCPAEHWDEDEDAAVVASS